MSVLKVSFVNGDTHLFPFDQTSTLHVATMVGEDSERVEKTATWSEVVSVEIVPDHQIAGAQTATREPAAGSEAETAPPEPVPAPAAEPKPKRVPVAKPKAAAKPKAPAKPKAA